MATSTVPRGRIEVAARRGWSLPVGWAIDVDGNPATTPEAALAGSLHPLGGTEETGGYKGYGLALVVDLLTGILGGARVRAQHRRRLFSTHEGPADLGQAFMVIDPAAIDEPGAFEARMEALIEAAHRRRRRCPTRRAGAHPGRAGGGRGTAGRRARRGHRPRAPRDARWRLGERLGVPLPAGRSASAGGAGRERRA